MNDELGHSMRINPLKYPNIQCDNCGNHIFTSGVILKKIPGLEVGTGTEDQILDLPVYYCTSCGKILKEYRKMYKLDEYKEESEIINNDYISNKNEESQTKSGIILDC